MLDQSVWNALRTTLNLVASPCETKVSDPHRSAVGNSQNPVNRKDNRYWQGTLPRLASFHYQLTAFSQITKLVEGLPEEVVDGVGNLSVAA